VLIKDGGARVKYLNSSMSERYANVEAECGVFRGEMCCCERFVGSECLGLTELWMA